MLVGATSAGPKVNKQNGGGFNSVRLLVQNLKASLLFLSRVQRASLALQTCLTLIEECAWKHSVILCLISVSICLIIVCGWICLL